MVNKQCRLSFDCLSVFTLFLMASRSEERLLWGWESFFDEINSFVQSADRQYGAANEGFSQYVIERTRICILNVSSLRDHLRNALDGWSNNAQQSQEESNVLECYNTLLFELLGLLRRIGQQWQVYLDQLDAHTASFSYQASSVTSGRHGRPRFEISPDQIIYLHSLSFSWKNISSMLGVSRMTMYRRCVQYGLVHPDTLYIKH